jgi:hypothetical protein
MSSISVFETKLSHELPNRAWRNEVVVSGASQALVCSHTISVTDFTRDCQMNVPFRCGTASTAARRYSSLAIQTAACSKCSTMSGGDRTRMGTSRPVHSVQGNSVAIKMENSESGENLALSCSETGFTIRRRVCNTACRTYAAAPRAGILSRGRYSVLVCYLVPRGTGTAHASAYLSLSVWRGERFMIVPDIIQCSVLCIPPFLAHPIAHCVHCPTRGYT